MELAYTRHAHDAMEKRGIAENWVRRAVERPQRTEPDSVDAALEHRLAAIPERGSRVLRVVVNPAVSPVRVITAYFDRKMKGQL